MCSTNNHFQDKVSTTPVKDEHLDRQSSYHVDGKRFIVTPVFRSKGSETLGSVLLKLMQTEAAR
jgi:hypothetical protein